MFASFAFLSTILAVTAAAQDKPYIPVPDGSYYGDKAIKTDWDVAWKVYSGNWSRIEWWGTDKLMGSSYGYNKKGDVPKKGADKEWAEFKFPYVFRNETKEEKKETVEFNYFVYKEDGTWPIAKNTSAAAHGAWMIEDKDVPKSTLEYLHVCAKL